VKGVPFVVLPYVAWREDAIRVERLTPDFLSGGVKVASTSAILKVRLDDDGVPLLVDVQPRGVLC